VDFSSSQKGWERVQKAMSSSISGSIVKTVRAQEYDISSGTMNYFASPNAPKELVNTLGEDLFGKDGKINEVVAMEQAKAGQKMLDEIVKKSGQVFSSAEIDGAGKLHFEAGSPEIVKFLGGLQIDAKGDIGASISRTNREIWGYNLQYGVIRRLQEKAVEIATFGGKFHPEIATDYYQKGMQELRQITDGLAKGKTEFQFGASSIIGEPFKAAILDTKKQQEQMLEGVKEILNSGVPYPMASEDEKNRRQHELEKFLQKYKSD
jgi:hypothetical protein